MELLLTRQYHRRGTNGKLFFGGALVCSTIELPWKKNKQNVSCIPEGKYPLQVQENERRGKYLVVCDVEGRNGILLHPANDARKELQGCIAPVTTLTGIGKGSASREAMQKVLDLIEGADEPIYLTITKEATDKAKHLRQGGKGLGCLLMLLGMLDVGTVIDVGWIEGIGSLLTLIGGTITGLSNLIRKKDGLG